MKQKATIIHEDEAMVIVNKPPFFLTIPDRYAPEKPNLYHFLQKKYGQIFVVHRLDKETSGILVFAKTEEAHKGLSQQFSKRTADKYYYTLVEGRMHLEEGVIDKAIAPSPTQQGRMIVHTSGKASLTHYKVIEYFENFTLVEANIKTGRTHQIRVHFEAMGYPLAVDPIYSRRQAFFLSEIKKRRYKSNKNEEERPLISRSILHAQRLSIDHPTRQERMEFTADLPKDFSAVIKQLRKWNAVKQ